MNLTSIPCSPFSCAIFFMLITSFVLPEALAEKTNPSYPTTQCTPYRMSVSKGVGGIRFMENPSDFQQTTHSLYGEVCGSKLTIELSKQQPDTRVSVKIGKQHYSFDAGETAHRYTHNWYRKYIQVDMPQGLSFQGG